MTVKVHVTHTFYEHVREYGKYAQAQAVARDTTVSHGLSMGWILPFNEWRQRHHKQYLETKRLRREREGKAMLVEALKTPLEGRLKAIAVRELMWTLRDLANQRKKDEDELAELERLEELDGLDIGGWS